MSKSSVTEKDQSSCYFGLRSFFVFDAAFRCVKNFFRGSALINQYDKFSCDKNVPKLHQILKYNTIKRKFYVKNQLPVTKSTAKGH